MCISRKRLAQRPDAATAHVTVLPSALMTDVSRLFEFAFSGRAVLLTGQNLDPEGSEALRQQLIKALSLAPSASIKEAFGSTSDMAAVMPILRGISSKSSSNLRKVADIPWAAVFTSSFDDSFSAQLAIESSQGRRLRHLCIDSELPSFFARRNDVLTVSHLAHTSNDQSLTGIPISGRQISRAERFLIPGILRHLAQAVGPAHMLCIAGIGSGDLLDYELVADFAGELDPENVYWFVAAHDQMDLRLISDRLPKINLVGVALTDSLENHLATAVNKVDAERRRGQILELNDLVVTVQTEGGQRAVSFRADELREFRRHLVVVSDMPAPSRRSAAPENKEDFIRFLSLNRQTPSWDGIAEGYAFERDAYNSLLSVVSDRLDVIAPSGARTHSSRKTSDSGPIYFAGPPASGRSVGLAWLGYQLRRRGAFVVHLLPSGGMIENSAVEQILRLAENRGAPGTVVLVDRADRRIAENLDRHLRSAGRRSLVVASVAPEIGRRRGPGSPSELDEEEPAVGTEVNLDYGLSESEAKKFRTYLGENYKDVDTELVLRLVTAEPSLFALLYRLIPDTRENIRDVLVEEYLNLAEGLSSFRPPVLDQMRGSTLQEQLKVWLASQGRRVSEPAIELTAAQPGPWHNIATQLPQLVLLFTSLDEAISLNQLTRRFPGLLKVYTAMRTVLENSGLFVEVALDKENDIGLAAVNPLVAQILLNAAIPSSVARINLLATLLYEFPWDVESRPTEAPEQALLIHIIRSISPPSGSFQSDYQRTEDLRTLADVLGRLREERNVLLPPLLVIEGIVLRHIGRKIGDVQRSNDALEYYKASRKVLETARDIVSRRRPTVGRNFEMSMILNAIAATIGHAFRAQPHTEQSERKSLVQKALETASESRAYAEAYHPLDTAFWTSRDYYRYLGDIGNTPDIQAQRQQALLNMSDALDKAGELGDLPYDQASRLGGRIVELKTYIESISAAREEAEKDAKVGLFGGVCLIARLEALDGQTNAFLSAKDAKLALQHLLEYAPRILNDDRALTLMNRLWIGAHLGNAKLDEGPYAIGASQEDWRDLERIASARRITAGSTRVPYVNFWLSVALSHLGDVRRALQMLEEVQANSLAFSRRRLSPLIYLSDEGGNPNKYSAIVRRRDEEDLLTAFVPALGVEVKISKRYQGGTGMMNVQRGEEVSLLVAFNYWNPMGIGPAWEEQRTKRRD
jgi:hypothetical protein